MTSTWDPVLRIEVEAVDGAARAGSVRTPRGSFATPCFMPVGTRGAVKALSSAGGAPAFLDTEILPGVEDLQVQFGIDTGDYDNDGVIDPGLDADSNGIPDAPRGIATRYVDPDALPVGFQVVSVRIWLMMRSAQFEAGFVDGRTYDYAGKSVTPNDGNRRMLVSRTIQLRNARQL